MFSYKVYWYKSILHGNGIEKFYFKYLYFWEHIISWVEILKKGDSMTEKPITTKLQKFIELYSSLKLLTYL